MKKFECVDGPNASCGFYLHGIYRNDHVEIAPSAERLVTTASENNHADAWIAVQIQPDLRGLTVHPGIRRVQRVRAVELEENEGG